MFTAIIAGLIAGIVSPLLLSWLQHKVIWRSQKKMEIKYSIFDEALRALSQYCVDALDPEIQASKKQYVGRERPVEARAETFALLAKSEGMVQAFFSRDAYEAFLRATRAPISIETVPNLPFEKARVEAIIKLASELGIM
jgi:hypothetical protein